MARIFTIVMLGAFGAIELFAQRGQIDPAFEKVPFERWLGEPDQLHFKWTVRVPRAELSFHQRLASSIEIEIDGKDLEGRRRDKKLVLLIQLTDANGIRYQRHGVIDLDRLDANVKEANINYSEHAFFVPGDYQIAVLAIDAATGEHAALQAQARIAEPPHEWLAEAWRELPSVEFIDNDVSPESWYLPSIRGRIPWAASLQSPLQLNVIVNVTPSLRSTGAALAAMLPTLKVIASPGSAALSERIAFVDLSRRKTVFEQSDSKDLDWVRLKTSLGEANTASIDVHSLSNSQDNAQYFVSEVRRVLRASAVKPCVLVVLTRPVSFDQGEDLEPVSLEALPACRVIYLRYHAPPPSPQMPLPMEGMGRRSRMGARSRTGEPPVQQIFDQLASTLKPLSPKVIDVQTPAEVSKAIAEIKKAILKSDLPIGSIRFDAPLRFAYPK